MKQKMLIFSGNPKAGSTWLGGLITGASIEMGLKIFYGQYAIPQHHATIKNGHYDIIISQSSNYTKLQDLDRPYKCIHVIRDPRDVCVSSYFSYKKSHEIGNWKALGELRNRLNHMSFDEGMIETFVFNKYFFSTLSDWNYADENVLELKYEDIIQSPEHHAIHMFEFLDLYHGVKSESAFFIKALFNRLMYRDKKFYNKLRITQNELPLDRIKSINSKLAFNKLASGRTKGNENINSHYRKGLSGDWKNYFSRRLKDNFKNMYGDLLIKLSYEKNNDW